MNITHSINTSSPTLKISLEARCKPRRRKSGKFKQLDIGSDLFIYRYYQPNPGANVPFPAVSSLNDPIMASNQDAWGLRIVDSHGVNIYGVGLYSFFDNYSTGKSSHLTSHSVFRDMLTLVPLACSQPGNGEACQSAIFSIDSLGSGVSVYNLNTVGTTNMIEVGGQSYAVFSDNFNVSEHWRMDTASMG